MREDRSTIDARVTETFGGIRVVRSFRRGDIDLFEKSNVSLMPADLHKALTEHDLADLVEYLLTLREAKK